MPTKRLDANQLAKRIADIAVGDAERSPDKNETKAIAGKSGGRARAKLLTPEQRADIAKRAAETRWKRRATEPVEAGSVAGVRKKAKVAL